MSSPLAHYDAFLLNNSSTISTIESSLRSLTWFLPGRFKDAEIASEALSAFLNITSLYHDTLLSAIIHKDPKFKPILPPSPNSRYTRSWTDRNTFYKWASRTLEVIRYVELVIEMGLRRKASRKNRWRGVFLLEFIKVVLRLMILKITRRPLLTPPIPERDFDPSNISIPSASSSPTLVASSEGSSPPATPEHLRNNRISLDPDANSSQASLKPGTSVDEFLLQKALSPSSVKKGESLMRPLVNPTDWLSEVLYILRPLIYVVALSAEAPIMNPLVLSLSVDLASRYLRRQAPANAVLERSEYARRDRDILWYLLRGSIWRSYTKPKLEGFAKTTASVPVLGLFSAFIKDWIPLIEEYYYYTAT